MFEKWVNDTEHGFLHGFLVSFFCYTMFEKKTELHKKISVDGSIFSINKKTAILKSYNEKNIETEKLFYSCFFHDYVKVCYGIEPHDNLLRNYFSNCLEETYSHKYPEKETNLIQGDRTELLRYKDYKNWCDFSKIKIFRKDIFHFYKHIRPALEMIIRYRNDPWISHVSETEEKHIKNYPENRWIAIDPHMEKVNEYEKYFSVNTGYLPIDKCHEHTIKSKANLKELTLTGIIPKSLILKFKNEITYAPNSTWGRDHPFVKENNKIPIEEWIFLYQKIDDLKSINTTNIKTLNIETLNMFWDIKEKILCKIETMKVE